MKTFNKDYIEKVEIINKAVSKGFTFKYNEQFLLIVGDAYNYIHKIENPDRKNISKQYSEKSFKNLTK